LNGEGTDSWGEKAGEKERNWLLRLRRRRRHQQQSRKVEKREKKNWGKGSARDNGADWKKNEEADVKE
jgi:hypothetical protein